MAGRNAAALIEGRALQVPPRTTALGALAYYVSHADPKHYQPTNITFGIMPDLDEATFRRIRTPDGRRPSRKEARKIAHGTRALADLEAWMHACGIVTAPVEQAALATDAARE